MIKNNISKIIIFILFLTTLFINVKQINADAACSPYTCVGTNAALKVNNCVYYTSLCGNGSVTPSAPYTCPTGGGPGSCIGWAEGVEGCLGNTPIPVSSGCVCSTPGYNSECSANGQSCGPYGGTCSSCTTLYDCGEPVGGYRGCCLVTQNPYCGDGICNNGETNCTCPASGGGDCAGTCATPPPGPYCGDGVCNNGETNCTCSDCTGTCPPTGGGTPSCDVSLSPSTLSLYTDSNPFNIVANVSNIQDGAVNQVEFLTSNSNIITMNPIFDQNGAPYQSLITPQTVGSTTITANVYFNGEPDPICSTTATINVSLNTSPTDEAPDCSDFTTSDSSVPAGQTIDLDVNITDDGLNYAFGGGFESGDMSFWPTAYQLDEWWAVSNITWPSPGSEGGYYAKIKASLAGTDPHAATDWLETGENLTGQNYTLKLKAKSHSSSETVSNVYLQRYPFGGTDWSGHYASNLSMNLTTTWQDFSTSGAWVERGYGAGDTTSFRVVLRPGSTNGGAWTQPLYYDSIKAYKSNTAGVVEPSVKFYYILSSADHCVPANWQQITGTVTKIGDNYSISNFDTAGITPGDYDIAVNSYDVLGNDATGNQEVGNPAASCYNPTNWTARPACVIAQEITACTPTCGPDTGCGTTNQTPGTVSNITVNGISGDNLNLSTNPLPRTISWTAATIPAPGTIAAYDVWLLPRGAATPANAAACTGTCRILNWTTGTSVSLPTVLPAQTNEFDIVVRASNACGTQVGAWTRRPVDLTANVSGNIYDLTDSADASNNCNGVGPLIDISAGIPNMTISTGGTLTATPGDAYVYTDVPYAPSASWPERSSITLNIANPVPATSFFCSCPNGTPTACTQTDTNSPATDQNFFVTSIDLSNGPWWQTSEGNVYAAQSFVSDIPDLALTYLITQNAAGNSKSAGIPLSGGTITAGTGWWTEYNGGSTQPRANSTTHTNIVREDYDYFVRNVDLNSFPLSATLGAAITALPAQSEGVPIDDAVAFKRTGDLDLNLNTIQTVPAGTKMIIFVSGNVTINNTGALNRHMIDIDNNGYLAIIAGGNITFSNTIGNTCAYPICTSTNSNIDGTYIASGQLIIDDNNLNPHTAADNMFVGEGTFVGWGGIDLQRTFDNTTNPLDRGLNNTYATEIFKFRPDFNKNTPAILQRPNLVWQEVN